MNFSLVFQNIDFNEVLKLIIKSERFASVQRQLIEMLNIAVSRNFPRMWPQLVECVTKSHMETWFAMFHEIMCLQLEVGKFNCVFVVVLLQLLHSFHYTF